MNMESNHELEDDLRTEYDFSKMPGGVKGKYVERYRAGTNVVLLHPDVAQAFPTSDSDGTVKTIDFGSIKSYNPNRGFGFVSRTFLNPDTKIFFHIKKIRKNHPELAQKLDNGEACETIKFWYKIDVTEKGEQVSNLWLNVKDIPRYYTHELNCFCQEIDQIWRNIDSPKPSWLEFVTIDLVGVKRRQELSIDRENLKIQRRVTEEKRRREAEAKHLRQIEARREKERQETELRMKLEAKRKEQIRVTQEEARKIAEQQSQQRKNEIRRICEEIGIATLVHFTYVQNLKSILQCGLIGRSQLQKMSLEFKYNDQVRLEGQQQAICLSISFPNYKMFYKYRCANLSDSTWVVLLLKPSILWELKCKFYTENAASNNARNSNFREDRTQPSALRQMFEDYGAIRRANLQIPNYFTTHPQAEVLVFEQIHPCFIDKVNFNNLQDAQEWLKLNPGNYSQTFWEHKYYFSPRQDWQWWQSNFY